MTRIELIEKRQRALERILKRKAYYDMLDKENYEAVLAGLVTLDDAKRASKEARVISPYKQLHRSYRSMMNSLNFA